MDTPTLRGLWLAAVDAPLAPAVRLVTCAGLALLGLCVALAAAAWMRFLRPAAGPISARPRGADVSFLAWCVGRLGLGTLALAAGARAVALALDPGADGAAALWYVLVAVALVGGRSAWTVWAAVLPLAPVPRPPVAADVRRIAEVLVQWDREAAGEVTTLTSRARTSSRTSGPSGAGPPRTHRMPDV
jgi:hypothetical protein